MILVDSHCHLDCLKEDVSDILARAKREDVGYFLCVCITQTDFPRMLSLANPYDNVFVSIGTHPNEVVSHESTVAEMIALAADPKVVAIGETGLDYYRTTGDLTWQQERFRRHIEVARKTNKPLIVHSRAAREDTIRILAEEKATEAKGVLHCFTENWDMAKQALDLNFYVSFSGIITFQNAHEIRDVVRKMPLDRLLIETDSPYLAPVPHRGKDNEPAFVRYVAEKVAEIKGLTYEEVAEQTTQNFFALFSLAQR